VATGLQQGLLVAAGGLHHDPTDPCRLQALDQLGDARWRIAKTRHALIAVHGQVQAGLAYVDSRCRHPRSPLELASREHRARGPRLSVRGKPRATVRAQGARSGVRPLLSYGGADTEALSGAHAGLSTPTVGETRDIRR